MKETGKPLNINELTKEQFDAVIKEAIRDFEEGRTYSADEVEAAMIKKFGIDVETYKDPAHE